MRFNRLLSMVLVFVCVLSMLSPVSAVAEEALPEGLMYEIITVSGNAEGVSFYAASLVFRNKIAVRYYFRFIGDITGYTFMANGNACQPMLKDGLYYVEVADILPENIDASVTLTVTDASGNTLSVGYSPMNYIVRMNEKGGESLKNLLKALYNYHLAAKDVRAAV